MLAFYEPAYIHLFKLWILKLHLKLNVHIVEKTCIAKYPITHQQELLTDTIHRYKTVLERQDTQ